MAGTCYQSIWIALVKESLLTACVKNATGIELQPVIHICKNRGDFQKTIISI